MTRLQGRVVYLDTNVFVYAVEGVEPYASALRPLVEAIAAGEQQAVTSEITLAEVLVRPLRESDTVRQAEFDVAVRTRGGLTVVPVSRPVLVEAARLRALTRLKLPDAVHAATARQSGCEAFLTNDTGIAAVPGVEVVRLAELVGGHG